MLLAIDAGNTNIVFALFDGQTLRRSWRVRTEAARTADEYRAWLTPLFAQENITFNKVTAAIIASVVPAADAHLSRLCEDAFDCKPIFATAQTAGLDIKLPKPQEVGADRLVNAVAVLRDYSAPAIVIDFGTATTFDVIDEKGAYRGGVIAPGPLLSAEALSRAAAKLPNVDIARPPAAIGTDTITAMQSGLYWGYVGLIEGLLTRVIAQMGVRPIVIATGGLANLFGDALPQIEKVDPDLTLRGLLYIYHQHQIKEEQ